jgi:hypothetical protein
VEVVCPDGRDYTRYRRRGLQFLWREVWYNWPTCERNNEHHWSGTVVSSTVSHDGHAISHDGGKGSSDGQTNETSRREHRETRQETKGRRQESDKARRLQESKKISQEGAPEPNDEGAPRAVESTVA